MMTRYPPGTMAAIDAARGDESRQDFVRRVVAEATKDAEK
jgi:hypothetical protein